MWPRAMPGFVWITRHCLYVSSYKYLENDIQSGSILHPPIPSPSASMDIRGGVDSVLNRLHSAAEYVSASEAPLDTHGAHPVPSLLTRSIDDIKNVIDKGPPFSLSDLVSACLPCFFDIAYSSYFLDNSLRTSTLRSASLMVVA
jgi:hypothetical protein